MPREEGKGQSQQTKNFDDGHGMAWHGMAGGGRRALSIRKTGGFVAHRRKMATSKLGGEKKADVMLARGRASARAGVQAGAGRGSTQRSARGWENLNRWGLYHDTWPARLQAARTLDVERKAGRVGGAWAVLQRAGRSRRGGPARQQQPVAPWLLPACG